MVIGLKSYYSAAKHFVVLYVVHKLVMLVWIHLNLDLCQAFAKPSSFLNLSVAEDILAISRQ